MRCFKHIASILLASLATVSCDTTNLEERLERIDLQITELEKATGQVYQNTLSLKRLFEKEVWIANYEDILDENSKVIGYTVTLNDGSKIQVIYGLECKSILPIIGIDSEGYWIVSMDNGGTFSRIENTPPATSENGVTPQLKVDNLGFWLISTDGGNTWSQLLGPDGKPQSATGSTSGASSSIFKEVRYDAEKQVMVFVLSDGQSFELDVIKGFIFEVEGYTAPAAIFTDKTLSFNVKTSGVKDVMFTVPQGWRAVLDEDKLAISAPQTETPGNYTISVLLISENALARKMSLVFTLSNLGSDLLDYSYAGYMHAESAPAPAEAWGYKIYNVCDYGAVPNDGKSDREAFLKCLEAAIGKSYTVNSNNVICFESQEKANAIVYFPEGEFIIHTSADDVSLSGKSPSQTIQIRSGNFILRGAGRDKTTLIMQDPNRPSDETVLYSSPAMIEIKHNSGLSKICDVASNAAKGSFTIEVSSSAGLAEGQWVCLTMVNNDPALITSELSASNPTSSELANMTNLVNTGVQIYDYHQIKSISGNKVTFYEPVMHEVDLKYTANTNKSGYNWRIDKYPHYENVGVEDLTFKGNAKADFKHHGSWQDDGAYKPINLTRLTNSWLRRVGFESVSEACSIIWSANISAYDIIFSGNRGHASVRSQCSSRVFIGATKDNTSGYLIDNPSVHTENAGQYHAVGVSKQSMGTVLWRNTWGNDSCFESHATQPRATLIDCCSGGWMKYRQGGDQTQVPNHLDDLVIWNFCSTTPQSGTFNFWDHSSLWWKFSPPVIVGFHGEAIVFDTSQVKRMESLGTPVEPESLYEQQLRSRLGTVPAWLNELK